jgi:hypothetical protein
MSRVRGPLLSAAVAAALALASVAGPVVFAAGLAVVILLFTLGGAAASGLPSARPVSVLAAVVGIGALAWMVVTDRPDLTPLAATLGPAFVVIVVSQLLRRDGRHRLTASLTFAVAIAAFSVVPAMWLALRHASSGPTSVLFGLLGVCVVSLAEAVPTSRSGRRVAGIIVGAGVATAVAVLSEGSVASVPPVSAVVLAAFGGALTAAAFAAIDRISVDIERDVPALDPVTDPVPAPMLDHRPVLVTEPPGTTVDRSGDPSSTAEPARVDSVASDTPAGLADAQALPGLAGLAALVPLRITLPVIVAAPAVYVLGRIFVG